MNIILSPLEFNLSEVNASEISKESYNDYPNEATYIGGFSGIMNSDEAGNIALVRNKQCTVINNCNSGNCVRGCGKFY